MNTASLLTYYAGAYGPTITIDVQSRGDLLIVRRSFRRLAEKIGREEDIGAALKCELDGIAALIARSVHQQPQRALQLLYSAGRLPVFNWSNTPEEWNDCLERVDNMLHEDLPGHHYLTVEGVDEALVELCYREPPLKLPSIDNQ
jgi:hypothetical protein